MSYVDRREGRPPWGPTDVFSVPDNDPETWPEPLPAAANGSDETSGPSSLAVAAIKRMSAMASTVSNPGDVDIGSGRGLTYEWEFVAAGLYDRVDTLEQAAPPTGTTFYFHNQTVPASSWTIPHNLGTAPDVLVLDALGQQLFAEVHYPDTDTAVVIHGSPHAGSAYLRG